MLRLVLYVLALAAATVPTVRQVRSRSLKILDTATFAFFLWRVRLPLDDPRDLHVAPGEQVGPRGRREFEKFLRKMERLEAEK